MLAEVVSVGGITGAPEVRLLDARCAGLSPRGLRATARTASVAAGARHVTRSYCHPYALIAWHSCPVGVDIERIEPCEEALARAICTTSELADLPPELRNRDRYLTSLWCSKEALTKALGDALEYAPERLEAPSRWPAGRCGPWRAQPLWVASQHTAWLCWQEAGDEPTRPTPPR